MLQLIKYMNLFLFVLFFLLLLVSVRVCGFAIYKKNADYNGAKEA